MIVKLVRFFVVSQEAGNECSDDASKETVFHGADQHYLQMLTIFKLYNMRQSTPVHSWSKDSGHLMTSHWRSNAAAARERQGKNPWNVCRYELKWSLEYSNKKQPALWVQNHNMSSNIG